MESVLLELVELRKRYNETIAVAGVSLDVRPGEIVCLLGPSGCGKTTLLRLIAGLETADGGSVRFAGRDMTAAPVHERQFGFMFQDFALFPHKNIAQNVAFGLRMAHLDSASISRRVAETLELVGLAGMGERPVGALSGGEQQRVALARSLAPSPRLLLLDEPLGSLDRALRERLMNELRTILKQVGVTALTVTHDQQEAFALADRIVVMEAGRALQVGSPEQVYRHPVSPNVARFLGLTNLLPGRILESSPQLAVQTDLGILTLPAAPEASMGEVTVLIRPEAAATCANGDTIPLTVSLLSASFRGGHYQVQVQAAGGPSLTFNLRAAADELPRPGEVLELHLDPHAISLLPTGRKHSPSETD